jgi:kinesin family protein C1
MNENSSRSHLIITISINIFNSLDQEIINAKLNLVDLAGSEKVKDSKSFGKSLKEACYIN